MLKYPKNLPVVVKGAESVIENEVIERVAIASLSEKEEKAVLVEKAGKDGPVSIS